MVEIILERLILPILVAGSARQVHVHGVQHGSMQYLRHKSTAHLRPHHHHGQHQANGDTSNDQAALQWHDYDAGKDVVVTDVTPTNNSSTTVSAAAAAAGPVTD